MMKIKQFRLHHVGRFTSLDALIAPTADYPSNVTVLVGNNGAGKTSILQALATSLGWLVARVRSEKGSGSGISEDTITNGQTSAAIEIMVRDTTPSLSHAEDNKTEYHWTLAKTRSGKKGQHASQLNALSALADRYRTALTQDEQSSLPLIAFYPVERSVLDIPLKIKGKHRFQQVDGYDNALNQGVDFRRFFEWFREREDIENEATPSLADVLSNILDNNPEQFTTQTFDPEKNKNIDVKKEITKLKTVLSELKQSEKSNKDPQLDAVRHAIYRFMPGFFNLRVRRKPRLHMSVDKNGEAFNVLQLSQGEKSLMALVGDIARRLAIMNPKLDNPLHGQGIVLIDEVDMHLHPSWQRSIIERLTTTFPHCQFILTTHSPLVISDHKDVLVYSLNNGELTVVPSQYGQDANSVLLDVMDTHIRNARIATKFNDLLDLIQRQQLAQAKVLLDELTAELPTTNLELTKARLLLRKQELRGEKNN
ncbi:AAA family ATPase [Dickeya dianthicola]|uniref:AAA family ATPase n=1 Tax=Dickeya dianthicola TaxID=204039 RepID=UPI001F614925|nr:AAA family ATPase [Dickeya dianthicola]MCI4232466.1 AAA family ATPase [Dickeya dianthicola]